MKALISKNKNLYILAITAILLTSLLSYGLSFQQAYAPGRIGGGFKTHESIRETIRETRETIDPLRDTVTQLNENREQKAEEIGPGENFGYPHGSTLSKYLSDPKFGAKSSDRLLVESFLSKGGLKLINNRLEFVEIIASEYNKRFSEEPLSYLEKFVNANLLIYVYSFLMSPHGILQNIIL